MIVSIKQLKQNNQVFFPQTAAEAILVKRGSNIITLDQALQLKIESVEAPADSGLTTSRTGQQVIVRHSNPTIQSNSAPEPLLVQHDHKGHIVNSAPMGKFTIMVEGRPLVETNGAENSSLSFGDDFTTDGTNIKLTWGGAQLIIN